jgi:hypothetical protein
MTSTRHKTGRKAGASKRPKLRRGKVRFITRAEARRRAERHVVKRVFRGARVRDGAEAGGSLYGVRRQDTWVVYQNARGTALRSSDVVVVCKRTGRVLYEGPLADEG